MNSGVYILNESSSTYYAVLFIDDIRVREFSHGPIPIRKYTPRVDNVKESSLREIRGSKNFALINLSLNFCETAIYDKVFLENLVTEH